MRFTEFYIRFPDVADRETRTATIVNHDVLPDDAYGFSEAFCEDTDCDCRRVFFLVHSRRRGEPIATLAWGWENRAFYLAWGHGDASMADELMGLSIPIMTLQDDMAQSQALLEVMEGMLQDPQYRERIQCHYAMWKKSAAEQPAERPLLPVSTGPKVGRNEPCPCGSHKKYKKCCLA